MQLPSNKVGLVLIIVVLSVASTIFFTKIKVPEKLVNLENVDLIVGRNTDSNLKSSDTDQDGLVDWQEELYGTDPNNSDTDSDTTSDGDEVVLRRDPTIPGPNDPLLTTRDLFNTEFGVGFATGTLTEKVSIDLFGELMNLKKNNQINEESQAQVVDNLANKVASSVDTGDDFIESDLTIVASSNESVKKYGTEFADITVKYLLQMDSYKNLPEKQYLQNIANAYKNTAQELSEIDVPDVAKDIHVKILNQNYQTGKIIGLMIEGNADPIEITLMIARLQASLTNDTGLYTTLGQYFQTNGIIFDDTTAVNFWNYYK